MGLRDANASNDRRYNWTKMFGTIARNEKGDPTDPCAGDSGDFFCLFLQEDPFQNIRSPPAMLIKRQSNPGGPLVWKSPASRSVLVGTVQGGGYDCRFTSEDDFFSQNIKNPGSRAKLPIKKISEEYEVI